MAPCSIGPRQMTGASSLVRKPIETTCTPYFSAGTICLPSVVSCVLEAEHDRHVRPVDVAVEDADAAAASAPAPAPGSRPPWSCRRRPCRRRPRSRSSRPAAAAALSRAPTPSAPSRSSARSTSVTPGSARTAATAWSRIWSFTGQAGVVSSIVNDTRAVGDRHVLHEAERDDVAVEVGVDDGAQGVEDRVAVGRLGIRSILRPLGPCDLRQAA